MSWNKNTVVATDRIDAVRAFGITPVVYAVVQGVGLNDHGPAQYFLRYYKHDGQFVYEYIERTHDCDADDTIRVASIPAVEDAPTVECERWDNDPDYDATAPRTARLTPLDTPLYIITGGSKPSTFVHGDRARADRELERLERRGIKGLRVVQLTPEDLSKNTFRCKFSFSNENYRFRS